MKKIIFTLFWVVFYISFLTAGLNLFAQPKMMELNQNWKFHQIGKTDWHNAKVPGCVHTDLLNNSLIPNPFYRTNEKDLQWIDKADWEYETTFNVEGVLLKEESIELIFKGLDTYADVFVNDQKILSSNNMFREWNIDGKSILKQGENKLRILFHSPIKRDLPKLEKLGYNLPAVNDQSENGGLGDQRISIFARKAPYHYGWDWGPRFVTSGIWRPIYLKAWSSFAIQSIQILQTSLTENLANLIAHLEVISSIDGLATLEIKSEDENFVSKKIKLTKGLNKISASFQIEKPNLWWPNGLGEQYLYNFTASVKSQDKSSDEISQKFGLRTIRVVQEDDSIGRSFYFKVNGIPVFMKGANYIPSDNFLNRVTPAEYEKIIRSAVDANMNMLRVWGGGIYENDFFYDLCDKYGILLWHDFMFACSMYPGDEEFLDNVRQEAIDNVKRLRNHPSIALWCGNNEMEDAWAYWGWKQLYNDKQKDEIYNSYKEIFFNILPSVVKEYDGTRFYWPSSPSSEFGKPSRQESGDLHYWGVWHGKEPFENFQDKIGRFVSEYGFQSFPELKTVQSYTTPEDWDIESEVMAAHQRSGIGNLRIRDYLNMYYKSPKDFTSFLYVGQVLQAYGIKQAIEAHRRAMPVCMGTLFWQIDDCWPVASWSSMDYYKRWKAMHYIAKKAYEPLIISPILKDDLIHFTVVNDYFDKLELELFIEVYDFTGNQVYTKPFEISIDANLSKEVLAINKKELIGNYDESKLVLTAQLRTQDKIAAENLLYFKQPKELSLEKPEIKLNIDETDSGYSIELTTNKLAKDVYLSVDEEGFFSDNYFDLLPGMSKTIELIMDKKTDEINSKIKVMSLVDSY